MSHQAKLGSEKCSLRGFDVGHFTAKVHPFGWVDSNHRRPDLEYLETAHLI